MLGNRLKTVREENGKTQKDVAEYLQKNQNTISSWEVNRTQPKMEDLHKLCVYYNCTYEYLTGVKQYDQHDISFEDILIKLWDMNDSELNQVKKHVNTILERNKMIRDIEKKNNMLLEQMKEYEKKLIELKQNNP